MYRVVRDLFAILFFVKSFFFVSGKIADSFHYTLLLA